MQPEPHWMNYVAIATGIFGSIVGYIAYRRTNEIKKSDRRLNVHKVRNDVHFAAKGLHELLPKALKSRKRVMNFRGLYQSGAMEVYRDEHKKDVNRAKELSSQIPPADTNYDSMNLQQLEQEWVSLDRIKSQVDELLAKYQDSLQQDQRDREQFRKQRPNTTL